MKRILEYVADSWRGLSEPKLRGAILWAIDEIVRMAMGVPTRSMSQVTPQLYLGPQYQRRGWPILAARGITAVVNMRAEFDDNHAAIAPARYLHLPTVNDEPPTLPHLHQGAAFIAAEIAQGGGVYVHCRSGVSRAATMVAAYLVSAGLTPSQAWARVRAVRPFVRPTLEQITQVERFISSRG